MSETTHPSGPRSGDTGGEPLASGAPTGDAAGMSSSLGGTGVPVTHGTGPAPAAPSAAVTGAPVREPLGLGDLRAEPVEPVEPAPPRRTPPSEPLPPVDGGRAPRLATRVFAALVAALVVVAAVATVLLLRGNDRTTASGYAEPTASAFLNFPKAGTVSTVLVKPGDHVRAGQVLVEQSSTSLEAKVAADQATLYADQAHALEIGGGGANAGSQAAALVAQAQTQLAAARVKTTTSLQDAQSHVDSTQQQLQQVRSTLSDAQGQYAAAITACHAPGRTASSQPTDAECTQIEATISTDQSAVDGATQAATQADVALQNAEAASSQQLAVANAAAALAKSTAGAVGTSADIAAANAAVSRDVSNLAADEDDVSGASIVSPVDGIVGNVAAEVGDYATPDGVRTFVQAGQAAASNGFQLFSAPTSTAASNGAPSGLQPVAIVYSAGLRVAAELSEHAVTTVHVGQAATVRLPALGGASHPAVLAQIEPTALTKGGKVYYLVDLTLTGASPAGLLPGMTADVTFSR